MEDEVDLGSRGEGGSKVDGGGGVEATFGGEMLGNEASELVVAAVAEAVTAASDVVVAVEVEGVEVMVGGDGFGGGDASAFGGAVEGP